MGSTYQSFLLLVIASYTFCSQSKLKSSPWKISSFGDNKCGKDQWKCPGEDKCIKLSKLCDGENDCLEKSDEAPNLCTKQFCLTELNKWKCPGESKVI